MTSAQLDEEHELRKTHVTQQSTLLKELLTGAQAAQRKELVSRQDKSVRCI